MTPPKLIKDPVTLYVRMERSQYEQLRAFSLEDERSIANMVRRIIQDYLKQRRNRVGFKRPTVE
jgi:hypothetical protein